MEVVFTIEAHADSEMPECMLGSTLIVNLLDRSSVLRCRSLSMNISRKRFLKDVVKFQ
jgi:hypothetical protein